MPSPAPANLDRRRFPRLQAPALCRELGFWATGPIRPVIDLSMQGARIYSDVDRPAGTRLEVEILLPEDATVVLSAVVAWSERLAHGQPAPYDIGLHFVDPDASSIERLFHALAPSS